MTEGVGLKRNLEMQCQYVMKWRSHLYEEPALLKKSDFMVSTVARNKDRLKQILEIYRKQG